MLLTDGKSLDPRLGRLWWCMEADERDAVIATPLLMQIVDNLLCIESDTLLSGVRLSRDEADDGAVFTKSFAIFVDRWGEVFIGVRETEDGEHRNYEFWIINFACDCHSYLCLESKERKRERGALLFFCYSIIPLKYFRYLYCFRQREGFIRNRNFFRC